MHAIIKFKNEANVEIQNDYQNMFHFYEELRAYIDVRYGDIYPEKNN